MTPAAILTPFVGGDARRAGERLWRKKILPVGHINYRTDQGVRVIQFTKDYLAGLAKAFNARAYDQVPLQLAPDDNKHTNDVERYAGHVREMVAENDGLYVTLAATERGDKVLSENPGCGVSARIVENYDRADGKFFGAAIQHVLATLDPRIPGLGGWQAVEASNGPEITVDLSGQSFSPEPGGAMPELTEEQKRERMAKLLEIDPAQIDKLLAGLEQGQPSADDGLSDAELDDLIKAGMAEMTDEELKALADEADRELAAAGAGAENTQLTDADRMAIEMANVRADENARQLSVVTQELDKQRFERERAVLAEQHGVLPYLTDLARPLMEGSGRVVELSNGSSVDAGQVVRKLLTEFGKISKMLDLGVELGTPMDEPDGASRQASDEARSTLVQGFRGITGI